MTKKILEFTTPTCGVCKILSPVINAGIKNLPEGVSFEKVSTTVELAEKYNIKTTPTFILLDENEKELARHEGAITLPNFKKFIQQ